MLEHKKEKSKRHLRTHPEHSVEDRSAISILGSFLNPGGRINTSFAANDTWPNHDGTFEFVSNPDESRRPKQNFFVQIKGTHVYKEKDGILKYTLKSLAFPAYICNKVSADPGILFVVIDPDNRGSQRVFWKYMSVEFLNSINFDNDSMTVSFTKEEEILNTDTSVSDFCNKLEYIINHHSFVSQLDRHSYTRNDVENIIEMCDTEISESIDRLTLFNDTRDGVSRRILTKLYDLCTAVLLLNAIDAGYENASLPLAWEISMLNIDTKYLGAFLKGLQYIGKRIPDIGQSERLILKYYDFLWQIRNTLYKKYGNSIIKNLEKIPINSDKTDEEYYALIAKAISLVNAPSGYLRPSRYYIHKKTPFFIENEKYYEITLQLAGVYASKYNRITVYTTANISTNYSIRIDYTDVPIDLWGITTNIKVVSDWCVSIDPRCLNSFSKILKIPTRISSQYGEYQELMSFLTKTGMNLLDLIDLKEVKFDEIVSSIYKDTNTHMYKTVFQFLREHYFKSSKENGVNVVRYLMLNLREEVLNDVMPSQFNRKLLCDNLYISTRCMPFEKNPFISNLVGRKTGISENIGQIINVAGFDELSSVVPYLNLKNKIKECNEIYNEITSDDEIDAIRKYNSKLDNWERTQGYQIKIVDGLAYIESYEHTTLFILKKLLELSQQSNKGQKEYNKKYLTDNNLDSIDNLKKQAIRDAFVNSRLLLIYGAAGTGKTTLINHLSNLMIGQKKLFLTKTHTALQNLKRRIDNPGASADFISIDSFTKRISLSEYDVIFVDECSTIDNRTMMNFMSKIRPDTFLVLAGDIHQIESIEFGNWFFYAKEIIKTSGTNVELLSTWRTKDPDLKSLWNEVRIKDTIITEKLVIDGPFSENIGPKILDTQLSDDEIILCLNYDGKFGLNNMNNYFQSANTKSEAFYWDDWSYKIGDPVLFNDSKRFHLFYNNLKGRIVDINRDFNSITFTIDVHDIFTESACIKDGIEFVDTVKNGTRIRFTVHSFLSDSSDEVDDSTRMNCIVPFQLAYAVSIHKAQGLEYESVKVIIPPNNTEKITHGIFYTAITRAKSNLKIYWSSETMRDIIKGFYIDESKQKSLDIIKYKLGI